MEPDGRTPTDDRSGATARTRVAELCDVCVRLADVDGGGVSMLSSHGVPVPVHSTDPVSATIEDLQFTLGEGPCIDAASHGSPVLVGDLSDPGEGVLARWPTFMTEARRVGVRAVFAFPIRTGAISLGTLDLYRREPGPLNTEQLGLGLRTVDAIGSWLLGAEPPESVVEKAYPMKVHQAAGMVMAQLDTSIEDALVRLRATAYAEGIAVAELASQVVGGQRRFSKEDP